MLKRVEKPKMFASGDFHVIVESKDTIDEKVLVDAICALQMPMKLNGIPDSVKDNDEAKPLKSYWLVAAKDEPESIIVVKNTDKSIVLFKMLNSFSFFFSTFCDLFHQD